MQKLRVCFIRANGERSSSNTNMYEIGHKDILQRDGVFFRFLDIAQDDNGAIVRVEEVRVINI